MYVHMLVRFSMNASALASLSTTSSKFQGLIGVLDLRTAHDLLTEPIGADVFSGPT